jgi:glucokinase
MISFRRVRTSTFAANSVFLPQIDLGLSPEAGRIPVESTPRDPPIEEASNMANNLPKDRCWIGFDLGGTKMLCQVYDGNFNPLSRERDRTRGFEGQKVGLQRIVELIKAAVGKLNIKPEDLGAIGVGCPGPLDLDEGVILNAPNLGWQNVAIKKELEQEFKCSAYVVNDVDAGVYGEYRFAAGRGARAVLGVFPGTGIGGGFVYDGELLRGKRGSCMEVGHIQVASGGPLCGFGRRGCLEAVASRLAICGAAVQAAYRGDAPHLMAKYGTDLSNIRSKALSDSIANGDKVIEDIVRNAARQIGIAVGNLVNLLLPDKVVVGGGLVEAMPDLFLVPIRKSANKRVMPAFVDTFEVVAASLGDDSTVMGAAAWAQHMVEKAMSKK